jgi:acetylornithine/N-succinyldiaminopimelate aminotransferase
MLNNRSLFLIHLGQTSENPMMVEIARAEGVFLYGPDNKKYMDLISGVCVSNVGHSHPRVVEAVKSQAEAYMHLMVYGEIIQDPQVKYARRLAGILPPGLDRCYFVNSGSEAVEGALKLAKRYTGRHRIISFRNAYHGSTHGALSIQGSELYRYAFRPLLPEIIQADFNDEKTLGSIDNSIACVIVEPVQGEAGIIYPKDNFLEKLRRKCSSDGVLLIFDEVQTGFGRTGYLFATDRFGVIPDILVLAKALGGGLPLGAFISSSEIMSALTHDPVLGHITTTGGNPLSCAAGLASLEVIIEENLAGTSISKSEEFRKRLSHPLISGIRGEALFMALELKSPAHVKYVISKAPEFGLILDYFLFCDNSIRLAPPLTISSDEIAYACNKLNLLLNSAADNLIGK